MLITSKLGYFVEGMCIHSTNWKENENGVLVNKAGKPVENSEGFLRLKTEVENLSMVGAQVVYYLVARDENKDADLLAKGSIGST